jgi:proline iminopeptidase
VILRPLPALCVALVLLAASAALPAQSVAHAADAAPTGSVHTEQVDLAYYTFGARGTALPIIAVNGGPGLTHAYMTMNDFWLRVAEHRLVVFYDQRGTGASKRLAPGASQTMDAEVADLEALRAHLGFDRFALLGDSFGGWIAMAYATAHPEHVAKLILSDSPGATWKTTAHVLDQVFPDIENASDAAQKQLGPDSEAAARLFMHDHFMMMFYSDAHRDAYMAEAGDLGYEPAVGRALGDSIGGLDFTAALPKFNFPTLVLNGRFDMNVAPKTAWDLAHAIPGAKLVLFEQSGHFPSYEEPEKYRAVLEDFLNAP